MLAILIAISMFLILKNFAVLKKLEQQNAKDIKNKLMYYKIIYNATGGSGEPAEQIKKYGKTIQLSSIKPIREGYLFAGWSISPSVKEISYQPNNEYSENKHLNLYALWYKINPKGSDYPFEEIDWQVLSDDFDKVTLITQYNINSEEVFFGNTSDFLTSNVRDYLKEWVENEPHLKNAIASNNIIYDEIGMGLARLPKMEEIDNQIPNKSNTNFWTMTASDKYVWYARADGSFTYQGKKIETDNKQRCQYGGPIHGDWGSTQVGSLIVKGKKTIDMSKDTKTLPTTTQAAIGENAKEIISQCCVGCGGCYINDEHQMACGPNGRNGYYYPEGSYVTRDWKICANVSKAGCNSTYISNYNLVPIQQEIGVRAVITIKKPLI